jgi:CheY-like chemotaxis protein
LAPIRNALELLAIETDPATAVWARDLMKRQVEHIVRLVDDLLDVSRITQGKIQLKKEPVEVGAAIRHTAYEIKPDLEERQQRFSLSLPSEPVWTQADPVRFSQIILNLLTNAVKYTDEQGQISLEAEPLDGRVTITVRDSGIGIPPDMLNQIFVPFTQVSQSVDRARGGLGIGLALVRSLVEMHGGTVTAHSEGAGKGSQFVVRLSTIAYTATPEPVVPKAPPAASRRVLVVDDNQNAAETLGILLQKAWSHEVEVVHEGSAALDRVAQFHPDVVLLDIGLPGLSGYDVARRIRELPEGGSILLVALTGYGQDEDRRKSVNAGFDMHLVKSTSVGSLEKVFEHPRLSRR